MVEDFMCNLKVYRVAQGLTQEQLAEKVGVLRETIMRLEKAQYNPSLKLAIDISRVLNAPIEDTEKQHGAVIFQSLQMLWLPMATTSNGSA